jgi:hypothetical protein
MQNYVTRNLHDSCREPAIFVIRSRKLIWTEYVKVRVLHADFTTKLMIYLLFYMWFI